MTSAIVDEVVYRCENKLFTQDTIAKSYAKIIINADQIGADEIKRANDAIRKRYPSKSGLSRVKAKAWKIVESRSLIKRRPTPAAPDACACARKDSERIFPNIDICEWCEKPRR